METYMRQPMRWPGRQTDHDFRERHRAFEFLPIHRPHVVRRAPAENRPAL
jgi:hypothetical protein